MNSYCGAKHPANPKIRCELARFHWETGTHYHASGVKRADKLFHGGGLFWNFMWPMSEHSPLRPPKSWTFAKVQLL